ELAQVRSPLDGRVRKSLAGVGTVVRADETVLAVVDSVGPAHALFTVDEGDYFEHFRRIPAGKAPAGKDAANVIVLLGKNRRRAGKIVAVASHLVKDPKGIARATVRVEVPNPDEALVPGMSVSVRAHTSLPRRVAYGPPLGDGVGWTLV